MAPSVSNGTAKKDKCYLLALPRELRDQIWTEVVVVNEPVPLYTSKRVIRDPEKAAANPACANGISLVKGYKSYPESPALVYTCGQIKREVLPLFYGTNAFVFNPFSDSDVWKWRRRLNYREGPEMIRKLLVELEMFNEQLLKESKYTQSYAGLEIEMDALGQ